ncbi:MAG: uridine monophosphate kinase [Planctomycetes bacterium]|nr:uridine monophosphate kinase [Planctomycetota bacterium]
MTMRPRLLKLSGEALKGKSTGVLDPDEVDRVCGEVLAGARGGTPTAIVIGGGNIFRGGEFRRGANPTRGDYMGMLATLFNALALKDAIERLGGRCEAVAPYQVPNVAHAYERAEVVRWLAEGVIVVFGGGTGHPFFTTDTAAALRAAEIGAAELLKGSKVDGIYSADPKKDPTAKRFDRLTFDQAIDGRYGVMDAAAFAVCRENRVAIRVFDMTKPGTITAALGAHPPGTLVGE